MTEGLEQVGRYRLVRQIGRGGMAEVLEAVALGDDAFERRVALKRMLAAGDTDPSFARMFLDEARIASQLHHANIVAVLDYGVVDGVPFQALELVDGVDAHELLRRAQERGDHFPVSVALHVCTEIAHALHHAHRARGTDGRPLGVVHRDVSPENILVAWSGDVKLTDFGIAFARNRTERTLDGSTKGKLIYMAPEQAMRAPIDGRTDVFSLGCVLHVLLTGQSPLSAQDAMVDLLAGGELALSASLPDDVRDAIARAIHPSKDKRFESAADMAEALGRALAARIDRDPRTMMREWLASFGRSSEVPVASALSEMLDVELVLAQAATGDTRRFESRKTSPHVKAAAPERARVEAAPDALRSRAKRAIPRVAMALAATVALAGVILSWRSRSVSPLDAHPSGVAPHAVHLAPPVVRESRTIDLASRAAPPAPPDSRREDVSHAPSAPQDVAGRRRSRPVAVPTSAPDERTGFVVFGGLGANRAEILVDGHSLGYAPKRLELRLGDHSLALRAPAGNALGPSGFTLTPMHTMGAPLRVIVP